ncbi:MAG: Integral rane protein [Acidobacteria bacterium]|nr:Integral rane protein [Acidobacteriota bacterium]
MRSWFPVAAPGDAKEKAPAFLPRPMPYAFFMTTTRLEAFSDGVIAILITIMVLELKVPHGSDWASMRHTVFTLLMYVLSFAYLGIYWTNHHHMLHATQRVNGVVLWANLHLLFWLSLVPFATTWMGENHFTVLPTAGYGVVLLAAAVSYTILQNRIIAYEGNSSKLAQAVGSDTKGKASMALYLSAIGLAFVHPLIADAIYVVVALIWLVPDQRIEKKIVERHE